VQIRRFLVATAVVAGASMVAGPALAAPTNAKNAFQGTANCGTAGTFSFVVNSANGHGQGAMNNGQNQAEWTPAHLSGGLVFHPTAFDTTFTFTPPTPPGGESQSFTNTDSRPHQTGDVTCVVSGSQTDPQGGMFSISGSVTGTIS
jgi:hypothetical protein